MPVTPAEVDDLATDAKVAMRDLQLIAACVRELVERADSDTLTVEARNDILPEALEHAEAVYRFLLGQVAPLERVEVAA
jgi:hypothetical protein